MASSQRPSQECTANLITRIEPRERMYDPHPIIDSTILFYQQQEYQDYSVQPDESKFDDSSMEQDTANSEREPVEPDSLFKVTKIDFTIEDANHETIENNIEDANHETVENNIEDANHETNHAPSPLRLRRKEVRPVKFKYVCNVCNSKGFRKNQDWLYHLDSKKHKLNLERSKKE